MTNSPIPRLVSEAPDKRVEFVAFSYFKHWGEKQYWEKFIYVKQALKCNRNIFGKKKVFVFSSDSLL